LLRQPLYCDNVLHLITSKKEDIAVEFQNETFTDQQISLDDNEFHGCTFKRCTLEYSGGQPPTIQKCTFEQSPKIIFSETAANTLNFLTTLYHGGFKPIIDKTFDNIRGNARQFSSRTIH
jgi:hypothetical protein